MPYSFDSPTPTIEGVARTQRVHRIVDFFSAAQAIEDNALYLPLAANFKDPNEAIDASIQLLATSAGPCAGITKHFSSKEEFIAVQRSTADRNYVSCWSRTKESIAMWALYSPDLAAVQLTTTVENIEAAATALAQKSSDPRQAIELQESPGQFLDRSRIASVRYDDFANVAKRLDRRRRAYDWLESKGRVKPTLCADEWGSRERCRAVQYRFFTLEHKDASFSHEAEVRLILTYAPYDEQLLAQASRAMKQQESRMDKDRLHPDFDSAMLCYARAFLRDEAQKRCLRCRSDMLMPLPPGFIVEVTIDPRCSPHKQRFMRAYFQDRGIPVSNSTCFGYAAKDFVVTPRQSVFNKSHRSD